MFLGGNKKAHFYVTFLMGHIWISLSRVLLCQIFVHLVNVFCPQSTLSTGPFSQQIIQRHTNIKLGTE